MELEYALQRVLSTLPDAGDGRTQPALLSLRLGAASAGGGHAWTRSHESWVIHAAYAGGATVATLPLEFYEAQAQKNVVQFTTAA